MALIRLFVAVPISSEIKERLHEVLQKVSGIRSGVKWVQSQHFHLTLAFLGDQEESFLPLLFGLFQSVAGEIPVFRMKIGGLGGFPDLNRPKVLFTPVQEGGDALGALADRIVRGLRQGGVSFDEKEFHGHVTLGRVKTSQAVQEVMTLQANLPAALEAIDVSKFILFKSRLTSEGPVHQALKEFPLAGGSE